MDNSADGTQNCDEGEVTEVKEVKGVVPSNICVVCKSDKPPYKCPTCKAKYCSVNCCKAHKSSGDCQVPPVNTEPELNGATSERNYYYPTKDTVPVEKLELLSTGNNLIQLKKFLEDPSIRSNILKLDTCSNPINEFAEVMEDDRFVQFAAFVTNEINKDEAKKARLEFDDDE